MTLKLIFNPLQLLSIKTRLYRECLYGFGKRRHGSFDLTGNDLYQKNMKRRNWLHAQKNLKNSQFVFYISICVLSTYGEGFRYEKLSKH